MTMLRICEAGALAAALMLGTAAIAEEEPGQSSGPAQGTNVAPTQGPAAAGNPGQPGMPGNKSGTAVYPQRKASAGQMPAGESNAEDTGETSGPATGTNVNPPRGGDAAAGSPGMPGMPGNKNGPAERTPRR
jgi:collagen type III alpha